MVRGSPGRNGEGYHGPGGDSQCRREARPGKPYGEGPAAALDAALQLAKRYGFTDVKNMDNYVGTVTMGEGDVQLGHAGAPGRGACGQGLDRM